MRILVLAATAAALCVPAGVACAMTVPEGGAPLPQAPSPPVLRAIQPPVAPNAAPPPVLRATPPPVAPKATPPAIQPGGLPVAQPPAENAAESSALQKYPTGCRDLDVNASEKSFIFHSKIYKFHQIKHWCWRKGVIYDERHAWSFDGGSTACFDQVYPDNHWTFTWWHGIDGSGDFSEERAHVTNCVFHIGDWKEYYPDVKIWAYADGTYKIATAN